METNNDTYYCHYKFDIAPTNLTMFPSVEKCGYCYDLRFESLRNKGKPMCRSITDLKSCLMEENCGEHKDIKHYIDELRTNHSCLYVPYNPGWYTNKI